MRAATRRGPAGRSALLACALLALLAAAVWARPADAALPSEPFLELAGPLSPEGEEGEGHFGTSVAVSADGSTALVGAPGDAGQLGAVWVFTRSGSGFVEQGTKLSVPGTPGEAETEVCKQEPGECGTGASVALSADGDTALVGAPSHNGEAGTAFLFARSGSSWTLREQLNPGPEEQGPGRFGRKVALSADGMTALVGAPRDRSGRGAVFVFRRSSTGFVHQGAKLVGLEGTGESLFGRSIALSPDGTTALVGAPGDAGHKGGAWMFRSTGGDFTQRGTELTGGEESGPSRFGSSVALSLDGETAVIGGRTDGSGDGAAWAFARGATRWEQQGPKLVPDDESGASEFGLSAALSIDGNTALFGGPRDSGSQGAVWVFSREGGTWSQQGAKHLSGGPVAGSSFGWAVALAANEGVALVGAQHEGANVGSAWAFLGTPEPTPTVTGIAPASGPAAGGTAVTITGTGFLPGASVDIGAPATSVQVVSETEITAVTAPGAAGSSEVAVSDLYGNSSGSPSFTYTGGAVPAAKGAGEQPLGGVLSTVTNGLAAPKLGVDGNLLPVSGRIRIKLPGTTQFVGVGTTIQVPFGTIVDATLGKVSVTTAESGGGTQTVSYYEGVFKLTQDHSGQVVATLIGGSFASCPRAKGRKHHGRSAQAAAKKKPVRKLWAEGHGKYSTKGNYATGAALGTRWVTEDFCGGTLIKVLLHRVLVTNLVTHRHFTITAGHSYLARAPGA